MGLHRTNDMRLLFVIWTKLTQLSSKAKQKQKE